MNLYARCIPDIKLKDYSFYFLCFCIKMIMFQPNKIRTFLLRMTFLKP